MPFSVICWIFSFFKSGQNMYIHYFWSFSWIYFNIKEITWMVHDLIASYVMHFHISFGPEVNRTNGILLWNTSILATKRFITGSLSTLDALSFGFPTNAHHCKKYFPRARSQVAIKAIGDGHMMTLKAVAHLAIITIITDNDYCN